MEGTSEVVVFLAAGALGGLVQAVIDKKGVVPMPRWDGQARQLDLGFLADLLIGSTGALATLVLGVAALNALGTAPAGAPGGFFTAVPRGLLLASFGALVGFGSRRLLPALSDRFVAAIQREVDARTAGLQQRVREDVSQLTEGQVGPLQDQQQALMSLVGKTAAGAATAAGPASLAAAQAADPLAELQGLVEAYDAVEHPDQATRLRLKDDVYNEMTALILRHDVPADDLVRRFEAGGGQGWILALAARLSARPEAGGGAALAKVGAAAQWKHVMYRVASAVAHLAMANQLRRGELPAVQALFDRYLEQADDSLRRKVAATRKVIEARLPDLP